MTIIDWLNGSTVVQGTPSVQVNPSSVASVKHLQGYTNIFHHPENGLTDKMMSIAPVGYSIPNPVNVQYNTPKQPEVIATPETRTTKAPKGRDCT